MRISDNGLNLIKLFEGLRLEAYQDIAGVWTIGYGQTGPDVQPGMKISDKEADDLLRRDLKSREDAVARLVKAPLNQNEFDLLVSFIYNVGETAFKNSTARARLNGGDRVGAAQAMTWWNKATVNGVLRPVTGLTRRRASESALFLQPIAPLEDHESVSENSRVTPVEDAPRRPNLAESRSIQGAAVAGAAGVGASTMGRDTAQELNKLDSQIASGAGPVVDAGEAAPDTGSTDAGATDTGAGDNGGAVPDAGSTDAGPPVEASGGASADGAATPATGETVESTGAATPPPPSAREQYVVQSQIQTALMLMIILSVIYIVFARFDDWWRYRR